MRIVQMMRLDDEPRLRIIAMNIWNSWYGINDMEERIRDVARLSAEDMAKKYKGSYPEAKILKAYIETQPDLVTALSKIRSRETGAILMICVPRVAAPVVEVATGVMDEHRDPSLY